ncbi:hypothetical protein ACOXCF_17120 [Citrobacter koseri]
MAGNVTDVADDRDR